MKTKPTEALKLIDETESIVRDIEIEAVTKLFASLACKLAFREGQSSPKIKQLEWKEYENLRGRKSYFAKTPFSPYEVADGGDHYTMFSPDKRLRFASADEAKAAAQADFEKRVKECLEFKNEQKNEK